MKRLALLLMMIWWAAVGRPIGAEMCVLDAVPAATLLVPYFEVELDEEPGVNTVFTIHNSLPTPTLAHVSIWTDWSQPVLDFDIFLTGYDAQGVDLHDVLVHGNLPVTADEQSDRDWNMGRDQDPTSSCDGTPDSCSPHGRADWDGSFFGDVQVAGVADCIDIFPFFVNPLLSSARREQVQAKLTGQPLDGSCFSADHGDGVARGYVTIDNARACSLIFPHDLKYFGDEDTLGVASNVNQLWGDWALVDSDNVWTHPIDPLVHIEADPDFDASSSPTNYTFYGRYTQDEGGIDRREPLGSAWGVSYFNAGFGLETDLIVWRDSTADNQTFDGYECGAGPDWQPLDQTQVACFDQSENVVEICSEAPCFPLETQRLQIGAGDLDLSYVAGWCHLNLNIPDDDVTGDVDFPASPAGNIAQSWVGAVSRRGAAVSGGLSSVLFSHACADASVIIDNLNSADDEEVQR